MNELLPYELELNQQWLDLPLPDENMAWIDMKRRLDEEDERRVIPFWLTGCAGWALLGVLVLGLAWWTVRPEKWFNKKQGKEKLDTLVDKNKETDKDTTYHQTDTTTTSANTIMDTIAGDKDTGDLSIKTTEPLINKKAKPVAIGNETVLIETGKGNTSKKKKPIAEQTKDTIIGKKKKISTDKHLPVHKKKPVLVEKEANTPDSLDIVIQPASVGAQSPVIRSGPGIDSPKKKKPFSDFVVFDSTIDKTVDKDPRKDSNNKRPFVFSAGIGLHQQLPVAGQTFVPYSAQGRKGSLADYIPSVYFRVEKEGKWFIQTGFRYGAPQLVKEFLYSRRSDSISLQKYNDTNSYLKKTFYHQLPFTVNYFIVPNLSVGAGIVWNKFSSAISTRDIIQVDRFNGGDTAISTGTVFNSRGPDSNFVNSYFQASIELHYKWKKFSFGANYSFGLQPYIRFILPGGVLREEKNRSLNVFIRYELWRSKKKSSKL